MVSRQEALHTKKLEQALRSNERFPINLEWMVDVFKYKHISSLTTHLKRHFKMNVHYKRFAQEQNKRVWTYFITVDCFIGICEYVRHAARKKIANVWLRKVGVKGARRAPRDFEDEVFSEEEDMLDDGVDEEEDEAREETEEGEEEGEVYEYYEQSSAKRRRIEEDEEYRCEEEEDEEERAYFQEMEEEEAYANYDTDESADYETSSSRADSPPFGRAMGLTEPALRAHNFENANSNFRIIYSSSSSSESLCSSNDSLSPPSTPTSPVSERAFPPSSPPALPAAIPAVPTSGSVSPQPPRVQSVPTVKSENVVAPANAPEMCKEQVDWSYLHLRPNPHPLGSSYDFPAKYFASLVFGPQYFAYPQQPSMLAPGTFLSNYHALHFPSVMVDPNGHHMRPARHDVDNLHCHVEMPNKDERNFDTNMFLSFPDEHHFHPLTRDL